MRWLVYRSLYGLGEVYFDSDVTLTSAHESATQSLIIGQNVHFGVGSYIDYSGGIEIGSNVSISQNAMIFTHNHGVDGKKNWYLNPISFSPLSIGSNSWIGAGAVILPSVTNIAEGTILGAGAVLTKNTEPFGIYGGNPARLLRQRECHETL